MTKIIGKNRRILNCVKVLTSRVTILLFQLHVAVSAFEYNSLQFSLCDMCDMSSELEYDTPHGTIHRTTLYTVIGLLLCLLAVDTDT